MQRNWFVMTTILVASWMLTARAQFSPQSDPFPLQLTTDSGQASVAAAVGGLNYVPGEDLVKFKAGVGPDQQQRALMAVRSRPFVDSLRWVGDVAVLTDRSQPNARILADQLSSQPEVLYAEPNYIRHVSPRPETAERPLAMTTDA